MICRKRGGYPSGPIKPRVVTSQPCESVYNVKIVSPVRTGMSAATTMRDKMLESSSLRGYGKTMFLHAVLSRGGSNTRECSAERKLLRKSENNSIVIPSTALGRTTSINNRISQTEQTMELKDKNSSISTNKALLHTNRNSGKSDTPTFFITQGHHSQTNDNVESKFPDIRDVIHRLGEKMKAVTHDGCEPTVVEDFDDIILVPIRPKTPKTTVVPRLVRTPCLVDGSSVGHRNETSEKHNKLYDKAYLEVPKNNRYGVRCVQAKNHARNKELNLETKEICDDGEPQPKGWPKGPFKERPTECTSGSHSASNTKEPNDPRLRSGDRRVVPTFRQPVQIDEVSLISKSTSKPSDCGHGVARPRCWVDDVTVSSFSAQKDKSRLTHEVCDTRKQAGDVNGRNVDGNMAADSQISDRNSSQMRNRPQREQGAQDIVNLGVYIKEKSLRAELNIKSDPVLPTYICPSSERKSKDVAVKTWIANSSFFLHKHLSLL